MSSLHKNSPYTRFVKRYRQEPVTKRQERLREKLIRYLRDISPKAFDFYHLAILTFMTAQPCMVAWQNGRLQTFTRDLAQPVVGFHLLYCLRVRLQFRGVWESKLATQHVRIEKCPARRTDVTPFPLVFHLYDTFRDVVIYHRTL